MRAKATPWQVAALMPLFLTPVLTTLFRHHGTPFQNLDPAWQRVIEDGVLVLAISALVAAVVTGIVTLRQVRRDHA